MQNSAISFSVCVDDDAERIKAVMSDLGAHFRVLYNTGVRLLTIRNYNPEIIGRLTERMTILLEQRSRFTYQAVFAPTEDAS
jgi:aspartate kinase